MPKRGKWDGDEAVEQGSSALCLQSATSPVYSLTSLKLVIHCNFLGQQSQQPTSKQSETQKQEGIDLLFHPPLPSCDGWCCFVTEGNNAQAFSWTLLHVSVLQKNSPVITALRFLISKHNRTHKHTRTGMCCFKRNCFLFSSCTLPLCINPCTWI